MSPTKMEVMSLRYEQIDDNIGSWEGGGTEREAAEDRDNAADDDNLVTGISDSDATTGGLKEAKVYSEELDFDDEDSVDELPPDGSVGEEARRHVDEPSAREWRGSDDLKAKEEELNAIRERRSGVGGRWMRSI